jgi:integrase
MSATYRIGRLKRRRADETTYWSYCIMWHEGRTRRRISLGTTDRPTADALARKLWATRANEATDNVSAIVDAYLDSLNGTKDEKRKREGWKASKPYWGGMSVEAIDSQTSVDYLAWRSRSINTARNELSVIRSALSWGVQHKMISSSPKIIVPPIPDSNVGHLTKPQFKQFLEGCAMPHIRLFAILAITTGARKTALLEAKWDQIDWGRCLFNLKAANKDQVSNKGRATVALNERAMTALHEARAGAISPYIIEYRDGPIDDVKKGISAASARTGVIAHPHMFRHSAAVWMAEDRVPLMEIAQFLGHRNVNITARVYARFSPDYLRNAAQSLTW